MRQVRAKKKLGEVVAMPGAERPEDVLKYLHEAIATGKVGGVVVGISFKDRRDLDVRICGKVLNGELVWMGAILQGEGLG